MSGPGVLEVSRPVVLESSEVVGVARRRRFTEVFKRRILDEVDRARVGEIGLILRREGLYSCQLAAWRRWRSDMARTKTRTRATDTLHVKYEALVKEHAKLQLKLRKAEAMLALQKKAAEMLNAMGDSPAANGSDS